MIRDQSSPALRRQTLDKLCEDHSFTLLGVVDLQVNESFRHYQKWLARELHAGMTYLEKHANLRADPRTLLPSARNAIVLGYVYQQPENLAAFRNRQLPWIAQYARFRDYHRTLRQRCESLVTAIRKNLASDFEFRICVDSAPILERALAAKSARGFIGKNTLFIHPKLGSFMLLAEILTDLDLELDAPNPSFDPSRRSVEIGGCGSCRRCQTYCPTNALNEDYILDANKCLSYWTIEHRGTIPTEIWPHLKDYIFGCDLCQLACPYNRKTTQHLKKQYQKAERAAAIDLEWLAHLSEADYIQHFGGTPLTRAKRDGLRRNALIALAVTKNANLVSHVTKLRQDPSEVIRSTCDQIEQQGYLD